MVYSWCMLHALSLAQDHWTPLHIGAAQAHYDAIRVLVADPRVDVAAEDNVRACTLRVCVVYAPLCATLNFAKQDHMTALDFARQAKNAAVITMLEGAMRSRHRPGPHAALRPESCSCKPELPGIFARGGACGHCGGARAHTIRSGVDSNNGTLLYYKKKCQQRWRPSESMSQLHVSCH